MSISVQVILVLSITVLLVIICPTSSGAQLQTHIALLQSKKVGDDVLFECRYIDPTGVSESSAADFTWTGPALDDIAEDRVRIVSGGSYSKLVVEDVDVMDAGQYTCSHEDATASIVYNLTVHEVPYFDTEMETEYRVREGRDIDIPCRVEKCYTRNHCEVFWRRNVLGNIPDDQCNLTRDDYGTTHVLSLRNVQQRDAGSYTCYFEIVSHKTTTFQLNVVSTEHGVPILDKTVDRKAVNYPDPLVLRCPVISGVNTTANRLVITWTFMDEFDQLRQVETDELHINEHYKRGWYECTASNGIGADSLRIFVEINAAPLPSVVTLPTVNLMEGEINVQLQFSRPTSPVAYFSLKYKWEVLYRDHWVSVHHRVSHKGRLNIENVTLSDAGLYRVNISNKFGYSLQTRQVTVRPITPSGGPTGVPTVPLGFMFQLPDMLSCSQLQGTSNVLTGYLLSYLESLCVNSSSLPQASCSNIDLVGVSISCEATDERLGTLTAMLQVDNAQEIVELFEKEGDTELVDGINIEPCGDGRCMDHTEVTPLKNVVIVLSVTIAIVLLAVVITVGVACCLKHKGYCCKSRCKIGDIEMVTPHTPIEPRVEPRPFPGPSPSHQSQPTLSSFTTQAPPIVTVMTHQPSHTVHDVLGTTKPNSRPNALYEPRYVPNPTRTEISVV